MYCASQMNQWPKRPLELVYINSKLDIYFLQMKRKGKQEIGHILLFPPKRGTCQHPTMPPYPKVDVAPIKSPVSSRPPFLSFSHDSLLHEGCVVSVAELCFTAVSFSRNDSLFREHVVIHNKGVRTFLRTRYYVISCVLKHMASEVGYPACQYKAG